MELPAGCLEHLLLQALLHDSETASDGQQLLAAPAQLRKWEFQMEYDLDWALAQPELDLPLQGPRV
ncbi:hypothetical protein FJU31_01590 [Stenotrophomonas cyclobalanopsidis]|uniref:Uncharacterized protein n=1 Tax=Stenotrophomonas cyclobalanopsidis TaxID=2771362 RepID=A0ABQ6T6D5_9GAMM|nr:hypothetical protein [Stenotrophomonas cyclobalanopsidis]KAA9004564.1 hypothetical protein FJU31_01590 [Stenotrophomonas cyclobalanopsidis]